MPKSMPSPTNSAAKATEIGFSSLTITRPSAAVTMRPAKVVMITAPTSLPDRRASHRNRTIAPTMMLLLRPASSDRVANSSSATATVPVRRIRRPCCASIFRSWATLRISLVA